MGPVAMDAEWIPLRRYSIFEFGASIDLYMGMPGVTISRNEHETTSEFERSIRGRYDVDDLECTISTVDGLIHEIRTNVVCLHNGYNLVGTKAIQSIGILGHPKVEWIVPNPDDPLERLCIVHSMGITLDVPNKTDAVYSVTLRPNDHEFRVREQLARTRLGNVTNIATGRWYRRSLPD